MQGALRCGLLDASSQTDHTLLSQVFEQASVLLCIRFIFHVGRYLLGLHILSVTEDTTELKVVL